MPSVRHDHAAPFRLWNGEEDILQDRIRRLDLLECVRGILAQVEQDIRHGSGVNEVVACVNSRSAAVKVIDMNRTRECRGIPPRWAAHPA